MRHDADCGQSSHNWAARWGFSKDLVWACRGPKSIAQKLSLGCMRMRPHTFTYVCPTAGITRNDSRTPGCKDQTFRVLCLQIGKLKVHKSGKVKLHLGNVAFNMTQGIACEVHLKPPVI